MYSVNRNKCAKYGSDLTNRLDPGSGLLSGSSHFRRYLDKLLTDWCVIWQIYALCNEEQVYKIWEWSDDPSGSRICITVWSTAFSAISQQVIYRLACNFGGYIHYVKRNKCAKYVSDPTSNLDPGFRYFSWPKGCWRGGDLYSPCAF